jgi:hypothetical protein
MFLRLLIIYFTFISPVLFSQKYDVDFEVKSKYGFLIAHRSIMSHIPKEHTKGFEFSVVLQTKGSKSWQNSMNRPKIGFSLMGTSAGNKELVGNLFGTYSYLQFPLIKGEKNFFYAKVGAGIGYAHKVFDQETNPKNIILSSHFNALINLGLFYQHHFKKSYVAIGLDLTHFSNGASEVPNLGANLPYISLAYGHNFRKSNTEIKLKDKIQFSKEWNYTVLGITTFKESYPTSAAKYTVFATSILGQKLFSHKVGYETGFDFIYKPSIRSYKPEIYKSAESMFQLGFYNGYVMTLDKLQLAIGMGIYLKDEYNADDRFYHRVGMKYYLNKNLFLNLTLKSHWAKADYVEYGVGFRF